MPLVKPITSLPFENQVRCVDIEEGKVLWSYEHPDRKFPFYASPALAGAKLLVGGRDKMLHAIGAKDGKPLWTFAVRAKIDSSPVVAGDFVVFGVEAVN